MSLAENEINKGVSDFGFKVVGFVTDNTGNVAKLRPNLSMEENYKDVQDPRLLTVIAQYRGKAAPFLKPFYDTAKSVSAKDWWNIVDIDQDLKEIIQGFLTCNPSTAPLERLFSTYGWIHDEHRNRMGNE